MKKRLMVLIATMMISFWVTAQTSIQSEKPLLLHVQFENGEAFWFEFRAGWHAQNDWVSGVGTWVTTYNPIFTEGEDQNKSLYTKKGKIIDLKGPVPQNVQIFRAMTVSFIPSSVSEKSHQYPICALITL